MTRTLGAFVAAVGIAGLNPVAVRFSNAELPPFSGAALRFAVAAVLLFAVVAALRVRLPRGRALVGALLYGTLSFGVFFALVYWALLGVSAGVASVVLALAPLLTAFLAAAHGLERLRPRTLAGGALAVSGIALVFGDHIAAAGVAPTSLVAIALASVSAAEGSVLVKRFPRSSPVAANAVGMTAGAAILTAAALAAAEPLRLPQLTATWIAFGYLVLAGSIALFPLVLFVLGRWPATSASYLFVLMPLITVPAAAALAGEAISPAFVVGGLLAVLGVYVSIAEPARRAARVVPMPECCPPTAVAEEARVGR